MLAMVALVGIQPQGAEERLQFLAMGDAHESRPASPNEIEYIGEIPVSSVLDHGLMDRPAADVEHVLCNKDTDPDCENSISPFVDKVGGVQILAQRTHANKARKQSLIMPWYEVASTGDGMGPETVTYWKLPPKAQMMQAQKAATDKASDKALAGQMDTTANPAAKATALGALPPPPNTFQDPTVWNGDHVLNGGNKEWAEEDGALHAYNMQRWRNKIIGEQIDRQRSQWDLMNEADWCDCNCGSRGNSGWDFKGSRGQCGHARHSSCGCSGQPGCGCSSTSTNSHTNNWDDGHSPGNSAHSHSSATQNSDYGYHSSNSESGRGVHVSVTGHGHHVTVNGHSESDFGGGNVNAEDRQHGGQGHGAGYQCHSCQSGDSYGGDSYGYHGRYDRRRRRGSRTSNEPAVLVDGEVPRELLDREGDNAVLAGAGGNKRKERIAANLRALADDADKALALLDDTDTPDGVESEIDTSKEMGKMLRRIEEEEDTMHKDAESDQYPQSEADEEQVGQEAEETQQERQ